MSLEGVQQVYSSAIIKEAYIELPHAEIYVLGNSTASTIATATLTQVIRFANNGSYFDAIPDHTNDHITINTAGTYLVTVSISFSGDPSVNWNFTVYKNNGTTSFNNLHTHRKLNAAGDVGSSSINGIIELSKNDTVELWASHTAGVNKDLVVQDCTMSIIRIGH